MMNQGSQKYEETASIWNNQNKSIPINQLGLSKQLLLPASDQIYISSMITNTFRCDYVLVHLKNQNDSRIKLRSELVEKYLALNANQYVFFTALFYMEKYLDKVSSPTEKLNLLPLSCLMLARKYQKGKYPNFDTWQQKLQLSINKHELFEMENQIICVLQFQLEPITRFNFATDLFLKVVLSQKIQHFCSYLLDLSVFITSINVKADQTVMQFTEAEIGLSVIRLACYFFNTEQLAMIPILQLGYNMQRIHECCSILFQLIMNKRLTGLKQIRHRYRRTKFMEVAKIQFFKIQQPQILLQKQKDTADETEQQAKASIVQSESRA